MILALPFVTPLLLIGLVAAGIPFLLHLLSSVRAQELYFPTLRFLKSSMEKTARRRRIQHWLLLLLRAGLLALLALAVAEPISRAAGGWLAGKRYAAAVILDNSYSMAARSDSASRFERAKTEAAALLGGENPPAVASLLVTNAGPAAPGLTSRLEELREGVARAAIRFERAGIVERVADAVAMLREESTPQKSIYLFTDLQRISFKDLLDGGALAQAKDVHLLVVNTAAGRAGNVGIRSLEIGGLRVVDQVLEFTGHLVNSSPTDRVVDVGLRVDGTEVGNRIRKTLRAGGQEGSSATVRFFHRFTRPGDVQGELFIEQADDLAMDNVRRFALTIGGRVRAVVVRGPAAAGEPAALDPAMMLQLALNPFQGQAKPWSIELATAEADSFAAKDLTGADAAFFCEVPDFRDDQARAVKEFVAGGGTAVLFLGPGVRVESYNRLLGPTIGLLPAPLAAAAGEVGPTAEAVPMDWVDTQHPYFTGLFEDASDYLSPLVQRYYRFAAPPTGATVLARLKNGDPLLVLTRLGKGKTVLCTTTASPRWTNLPITSLFLPVMARAALLSRQDLARDENYPPGARVEIRPSIAPAGEEAAAEATVHVTAPGAEGQAEQTIKLTATRDKDGVWVATFVDTAQPGLYRWQVAQADVAAPGTHGQFVVNPDGLECDLDPIPGETFVQALRNRGIPRVYVGPTLSAVNAAASAAAQGRNWWDLLVAGVILLLVVEAIVSNRLRQAREDQIPAHLNPHVAAPAA